MATDILVAEDEPGILEALSFVLQRAGWTVQSVTDGDAVLSAVRRERPRVLVLDIMLPKRSGFEVLKQLRADVLTRALPVLVLTARGAPPHCATNWGWVRCCSPARTQA
ncbi:MAG: response regulator [Devosia sp.]